MPLILRPYQEEIKSQIYEAWDSGHKNVLLVLPTGMGKTKTFCSIAIDKAITPNQGKLPTAIMVHRKELVQQISLTLAEEQIPHNIIAPRPVIKNIIASQRMVLGRQFYDYNASVTVISVDTLNARINHHEKWAKSIRLWITDEAAHLLTNNKWGRAVSYFPNAIGLGVTATPRRLDKRGLGRHADGVFDVMIKGPTTRYGISQGYLSRYKIAIPQSDYRLYLKKAKDGSDYSKEAMITASSKSHIVGDAVQYYTKHLRGKRAIYFCDSITAGDRMETEFNSKNVRAKLLTGETSDTVRLKSLIDFRDKKLDVLLNVDLFDEGLDVPGIEVVGMCRPTASLSKYLQMVGRGLRVMANKEFCYIIDHVGNVMDHGLPDDEREWTLDRIIKKRDKINLIRICCNIMCNAPFDRALTACPYCGTEIPKPNPQSGSGRIPLEQVDGDLELVDPDTFRELMQLANLEDPAKLAERVGRATNGIIAVSAMKNQIKRIDTQKELVQAVAKWAGFQKACGYSDRSIHKKFYLNFEKTITQALNETEAEMRETMRILEEAAKWKI